MLKYLPHMLMQKWTEYVNAENYVLQENKIFIFNNQ